MAQILNVPGGSGILIERVAEGSLGHRLGLKPGFIPITIAKQEIIAGGDIVVQILGQPVPNGQEKLKLYFDELRKKFRSLKPGTSFSVKVLRSGNIVELDTIIE